MSRRDPWRPVAVVLGLVLLAVIVLPQVRLLRAAVARLSRDGVLYFSNNFRRFRLDDDAVQEFAECTEISAATIPPDFERDARIHHCWRLRRLRD